MLGRILSSLEDDKAEDIVTIDLRGRSAMADHMVIASGRNARQVASIAEKLVDRLKHTDDVIVHVFRPEVREFYQLEKMWMPADALGSLRADAARDAATLAQ